MVFDSDFSRQEDKNHCIIKIIPLDIGLNNSIAFTELSMEKIGRYKIVSELGRGGMATVYHATDPSFERDVAIKVLPQAFLHDPHFRARFEREAKMIAALEHAAIVPVYDFGEDNGQPFIVMRMMSGGSLADKLKEGKFDVEEAAQVVTRVATALDAAHQKGIIHRDLKPGNILFDQYNNAFLSDFGIARLAAASATLTGSNILGTPAYMSPEQIQGDSDIDGRSDVYSLGVLFYQMLVGNTPYQATTPAKVMMMHILEPVPNLMNTLPEVSPAVEAWFEKVLAKEPDNRYATAGKMADALQSALRGDIQTTMAAAQPLPAAPVPQDQTMVSAPIVAVTPPQGTPPPTASPPPITPPPSVVSTPQTPYPVTPERPLDSGSRRLPLVIGGLGLLGIIVVCLAVVAYFGFNGTGPLAMLAADSATPTVAAVLPTETTFSDLPTATLAPTLADEAALSTPEISEPTEDLLPPTEALPSDTPEPTLAPTPDVLVIGGADKIAFINQNEIWIMKVDGSDLRQLTSDGAEKTRLSWMPDGSALMYISGRCVWSIDYETERQDFIACFETAKSLDDFSVSSAGDQAAVTLNQNLYVVPFDRDLLAQARFPSDLDEMGECEALSPLKTGNGTNVIVNQVRWSADDSRMAINVVAPVNGIQSDLIRFTNITDCQYPDILDEFPSRRLEIDDYDKFPYIQNFGYDGYYLFSMVSYTRNDGYGHLYFYNTDLHRSESKVNPIDGTCCYRDPQFSPDGRYFIFAYQLYDPAATTQLYYVPFASIGTGANMEPLPLPEGFFADRKVKPMPVLRPAGQ